MLQRLTSSEEELIKFIESTLCGRYTELQISPSAQRQRHITLWYIGNDTENLILDIQLPASAFKVEKSGDIVFISQPLANLGLVS